MCAEILVCLQCTFLEMTYICKLGEDQNKSVHPVLDWFLSPNLGVDQKKRSSPRIGMVFEHEIRLRPKKKRKKCLRPELEQFLCP